MSKAKDPGIKLFGRTIQLPEIPVEEAATSDRGLDDSVWSMEAVGHDNSIKEKSCPSDHSAVKRDLNGDGAELESTKDSLGGTNDGNIEEDGGKPVILHQLTEPNGINQIAESATVDDVATSSKPEEEHNEGSNSQDKALKKPDKILPCPRCNSMDTKFCYYNNYNVNQPRHFCKNCQRYWTAGGTMRNVPVGAGRRKNKNLASQCRHIIVSEAIQSAQTYSRPTLDSNGTVLTLGYDTPLCESMASGLKIAEKTLHKPTSNGFHGPELLSISSYGRNVSNADDHVQVVMGSSKDEASKEGLSDNLVPDSPSIPPQVACFPGPPWAYPWSSVQWSSPVSPVAFRPAAFPVPVYPAAPFWGCTSPGVWNVPWHGTPPPQIPGHYSPTLGKHSRDDYLTKLMDSEKKEIPKESNPEKCFWVPKTLRIDDPGEAEKSSIWTTLGIKRKKADSVGEGGFLKAFEPKGDEMTNVSTASSVLQANPAALSRSLRFHESSSPLGA